VVPPSPPESSSFCEPMVPHKLTFSAFFSNRQPLPSSRISMVWVPDILIALFLSCQAKMVLFPTNTLILKKSIEVNPLLLSLLTLFSRAKLFHVDESCLSPLHLSFVRQSGLFGHPPTTTGPSGDSDSLYQDLIPVRTTSFYNGWPPSFLF